MEYFTSRESLLSLIEEDEYQASMEAFDSDYEDTEEDREYRRSLYHRNQGVSLNEIVWDMVLENPIFDHYKVLPFYKCPMNAYNEDDYCGDKFFMHLEEETCGSKKRNYKDYQKMVCHIGDRYSLFSRHNPVVRGGVSFERNSLAKEFEPKQVCHVILIITLYSWWFQVLELRSLLYQNLGDAKENKNAYLHCLSRYKQCLNWFPDDESDHYYQEISKFPKKKS